MKNNCFPAFCRKSLSLTLIASATFTFFQVARAGSPSIQETLDDISVGNIEITDALKSAVADSNLELLDSVLDLDIGLSSTGCSNGQGRPLIHFLVRPPNNRNTPAGVYKKKLIVKVFKKKPHLNCFLGALGVLAENNSPHLLLKFLDFLRRQPLSQQSDFSSTKEILDALSAAKKNKYSDVKDVLLNHPWTKRLFFRTINDVFVLEIAAELKEDQIRKYLKGSERRRLAQKGRFMMALVMLGPKFTSYAKFGSTPQKLKNLASVLNRLDPYPNAHVPKRNLSTFMYAVKLGYLGLAKYLIVELKADKNQQTSNSFTACDIAKLHDHSEVVTWAKSIGITCNKLPKHMTFKPKWGFLLKGSPDLKFGTWENENGFNSLGSQSQLPPLPKLALYLPVTAPKNWSIGRINALFMKEQLSFVIIEISATYIMAPFRFKPSQRKKILDTLKSSGFQIHSKAFRADLFSFFPSDDE